MTFKRSEVKNRCVHTLGDKQQPRRSMLLLLDDVFYEHIKKDKDAGQSHEDRAQVADDILARMELLQICNGKELKEQWALVSQRDKTPYPGSDLLIECQIFGDVKLNNHGESVIINSDALGDGEKEKILGQVTNTYNLEYLPYTQALATRDKKEYPSQETRKALLNKKAKDFTTMP